MGGAPTSARGPATTSNFERHEQLNWRGALTLSLVSSEAMMCSQSYDIMHVEEVERLTKVGVLFQFPALMYPNLFHHRSTRYYHYASGRFKEIKLATGTRIRDAAQDLARLNASSSYPLTLHAYILRRSTSVFETSENKVDAAQMDLRCVQEHATNATGRRLLEHYACALVPAKQQLRSAQRKELEDPQARLDTSKARS